MSSGDWGYEDSSTTGGSSRREDKRENHRDDRHGVRSSEYRRRERDSNQRPDRGYDKSYQRSDRGGYDKSHSYGPGSHSSSLEISSNQVGKLIGRGGSNIRDIQSKFSVNVNVAKESNSDGEKTVTVSGNRQSHVDEAVAYISDQLENSKPYGEEKRYWDSGHNSSGSGSRGYNSSKSYGRYRSENSDYNRRDKSHSEDYD